MQTILEVWRDYVARHLDRPFMWSRDEIRQATRDTMVRNINKDNAPRQRTRPTHWFGENGRNIRREFGRRFAGVIADGSWCEAVDLLQSNEFWAIREYSIRGWADLIGEKFNTDNLRACEDCGHIDHVDDGSWAYDENWVCSSCIDDNYRWSDSRDCKSIS